jgi:hypothetical protein
MCDNERLHFADIMEHEQTGLIRLMGPKCARTYVGTEYPRLLKERQKSYERRKRRWLTRRWRVSRRGNDFLKLRDVTLGIFMKESSYGYWFEWLAVQDYRESEDDQRHLQRVVKVKRFSDELYLTAQEAKLALFDELWRLNLI